MCDQFLHLKFLWKLQGVRDRSLAIFVFLLVCIDIALLLIYTISQGLKHNLLAKKVPNKENSEDIVGVRKARMQQ